MPDIPVIYAFSAGMVATVNPCGFAMLPAYLGLYLGDKTDEQEELRPIRHLGKALLVGGTVTAGFVVLFGVAGTVIGLGASFVSDIVPWLGLVIGVVLAIIGAWMVGGGKLYTGFAAQAANRMATRARSALADISCSV